jgi:biofilm PGA synthesis N-glycosyltransferase PgaC
VIATSIFLLSAAFVLYVLAGYPLLVAALARRRGRPVRKSFEPRTVTVLLPVRNGEPWLRDKLRSILSLDYPRELVQVLVISDGSTDRTEEIAREFAAQGVELLSIQAGGKALALNAGMARARGEILFFTDVRQALAPDSLRNLVACFADPEVGAASGELIIREGDTQEEAHTGLYWRYEKWIRKRLSRLDSVMGTTGCIYAMRASLAVPLAPGTILDDVNLPLGAFFRGYRVILDESARAFDFPTSLKTEFRRKVRTLAGVYQTIGAFPALLGPANRMWIHFVSHKLGRLILPWALVSAAASSFFLPAGYRDLALAAQAAGYALALADPLVPERFPLKRLTSPVRTFVVLMAAALCAVSILFLPRQALWKETRTGVRAARSA